MSDTPPEAVLAAIEQLGVRMDRLEAARERVVGRLDDLEAGQRRLRTDVMERMDRLQTGLDHLRDGHVVDWGNADRVERMAALPSTRCVRWASR